MNPRSSISGLRLVLLLTFMVFSSSVPARRAEAGREADQQRPAPGHVDELDSRVSNHAVFPPRVRGRPAWADRLSRDLTPFLRDAQLRLELRNYYRRRENETTDAIAEAWAQGIHTEIASGRLFDVLSLGLGLFSSLRLVAPEDRRGAELLLAPGQGSFAVLGTSFAQLDWKKQRAKLFRSRYALPFLDGDDVRIVPNTFEGYTLEGLVPLAGTEIRYVAGYVAKIKPQDANDFEAMSERAGAPDSDSGTVVTGLTMRPSSRSKIGVTHLHTLDVQSTFHAAADWTWRDVFGVDLRAQIQFSDQRPIGARLGTALKASTQSGGAQLAASARSFLVRIGVEAVSDDNDLVAPFGSHPSFTSLMQSDFNRSGEVSLGISTSAKLDEVGWHGGSAMLRYGYGLDGLDAASRTALPDEQELNLTFGHDPQEGRLRRLSVRLRYAWLDRGSLGAIHEGRIIVGYAFHLL